MESKKEMGHKECNGCCMCAGMNTHRHGVLRLLVIILGAMLIFWCGFKLGIIKGYIVSQYGGLQMYGDQGGMMMHRQWNEREMMNSMQQVPPTMAVPATTTTVTTPAPKQ